MTWASRRRTIYLSGIALFFALLIGIPLYFYLDEPETCEDGIQNQGETAVDKGGPCPLLDERVLTPYAVEWTRGFQVRNPDSIGSGSYNALAYVDNPNEHGGVMEASYRFKLYDENNVIVTEREGVTYIMPGAVTPVFEGSIDTGNRVASRAFFEFSSPLVWERLDDRSRLIVIENKQVRDATTYPRLSAVARNTSVTDLYNTKFVAVIFDPAGNAMAASQTILDSLPAGESRPIVFTWPKAFTSPTGKIDITPLLSPERP